MTPVLKKLWLCIIGLMIVSNIFGQTSTATIDSLRGMLQGKVSDIQRINLYNLLARAHRSDSTQVSHYALRAIRLSRQLKYPEGLVNACYEMGWMLSQKGYYTQATAYFRQSLQAAQQTANQTGIADAYEGLGIVQSYQGTFSITLEYYNKALQLRKKEMDSLSVAQSYNYLGNLYFKQGHYPQALDYYLKSLEIREDYEDHETILVIYNNIGVISYEQEDYPQALKYYKKGLRIAIRQNDQEIMGDIYLNLGLTHQKQGNHDKALQNIFKSLEIFDKLKNLLGKAYCYQSLGDIYVTLHKQKLALQYLNKALRICGKLGEKLVYSYAQASLGKVYYQLKNYSKAIEYLKKSLRIAQKSNNLQLIAQCAQALAKTYKATGNFKKAYQNYTLFKHTSDSIFNKNNTRKIARMEARHLFEKRNDSLQVVQGKEKALLMAQAQQQRIIQQATYIGLGLSLLLLITLARFYRSKQRNNHLLNQTNLKLEKANKGLTNANEELQQNKEEITSQRDTLEMKNVELSHYQQRINQSFRAAQTIQNTLLSTSKFILPYFQDYFIMYLPKDVVSGDFYWMTKVKDELILVVADCTGHGVPGAFMTLISSKLLDSIIKINQVTAPAQILSLLDEEIQTSLKRKPTTSQAIDMVAGMDAVVLNITSQNGNFEISFAGAKNDLLYFDAKKQALGELKGTRKSVGGFQTRQKLFAQHHISLSSDSILYMGSDGLPDQNNEQRKRFGYDTLKKLLAQNAGYPMAEQQEFLQQVLRWHMQKTEQRDDILWMGLKL